MSLFEFVTEDLVSEDEARLLTLPIQHELVEVWASAWDRWRDWPEDDRRRLGETPNARPVNLNAFVQSFAREKFSQREVDGLVVCDNIPGVFAIYVHKKLLLRFNCLGRNHIVRCNGASKLKKAFFNQEPIPKVDNSATRIAVGYVLDIAGIEMQCIEMSCQVGDSCFYHFPIDSEEGGVSAFPSPTVAPSPHKPTDGIAAKKPG